MDRALFVVVSSPRAWAFGFDWGGNHPKGVSRPLRVPGCSLGLFNTAVEWHSFDWLSLERPALERHPRRILHCAGRRQGSEPCPLPLSRWGCWSQPVFQLMRVLDPAPLQKGSCALPPRPFHTLVPHPCPAGPRRIPSCCWSPPSTPFRQFLGAAKGCRCSAPGLMFPMGKRKSPCWKKKCCPHSSCAWPASMSSMGVCWPSRRYCSAASWRLIAPLWPAWIGPSVEACWGLCPLGLYFLGFYPLGRFPFRSGSLGPDRFLL